MAVARRPIISLPFAVPAAAIVAMLFSSRWSLTVGPERWLACAIQTLAALLPVAWLMRVFYVEDRLEAEPLRNLARYFAVGVLSLGLVWVWHLAVRRICPAWLLTPGGAGAEFVRLVAVVGLGEELCKYVCFRAAALRDAELDEPYDACIYAVYVGLGFAGLENLAYVVHPGDTAAALGIAALRGATAVPAHALFSATWGVTFGLVRIRARPRFWLPASLALAALAHGLYDWLAQFFSDLHWPVLGVLALFAILISLAVLCARTIPLTRRLSPYARSA